MIWYNLLVVALLFFTECKENPLWHIQTTHTHKKTVPNHQLGTIIAYIRKTIHIHVYISVPSRNFRLNIFVYTLLSVTSIKRTKLANEFIKTVEISFFLFLLLHRKLTIANVCWLQWRKIRYHAANFLNIRFFFSVFLFFCQPNSIEYLLWKRSLMIFE